MYTKSLNQGFKIIDERVKERYITEILRQFNLRIHWREINTRYNRELRLVEQDENKRKVIGVISSNLKKQ